jgi:glycerate kinase
MKLTLEKIGATGCTSVRVLIVPDKFKGTLAASAACRAIARGWKSVRPEDQFELLPMSDGGDGFGEVMGGLLKARLRSVNTLDAAHRPVKAHWWWVPDQAMAIIESARVIGLAMLPANKYHPFQLDTFGFWTGVA